MQMTDIATTYLEIFQRVIVVDFARYWIGAGGVFVLINVAFSTILSRQQIRDSRPGWAQIGREILASLRTIAIFATVGSSIGVLAQLGVIPLYFEIAERGWIWFVASCVLLILAHDAWFYWTHRAMHHPRLFRMFHRLHHRSHNPTPFTSYAFDWSEAIVNAVYLPLALMVIPTHPLAILIFACHMILRNALGHCGYEVFPARADGRPLFGWMTTVTHHDLHHAQAGWNMGLYFTWWDRWMGTEHPDYLARYAARAPRITGRRDGHVSID